MIPSCISIVEAANALGISRTKAFELVGSGALKTIRIGRRNVVPVSSISDFIDRSLAQSHPALVQPDGGYPSRA